MEGNFSEAIGGDGGQTVIGPGGRGGHAVVEGNNSRAIGGRGGRGGLGSGGDGGDAFLSSDNAFYAGGDGGEANQADGRGGRGGMPHVSALAMMESFIGLDVSRVHMRAPYWLPNTIYGSGGHGADSIQHTARRLILEELKVRYFADHGHRVDRTEVWYDRTLVPLDWLNTRLQADGHAWSVSVVDHEYEFADGTIHETPSRL